MIRTTLSKYIHFIGLAGLLMVMHPVLAADSQSFTTSSLKGSIGGKVWQEKEPVVNHVLDFGEDKLLYGIEVALLDEDGIQLSKTATDSSGCYFFTNLVEGSYQVRFFIPDNLSFINPNEGNDELLGSDVVDLVYGRTDVFFLKAEEQKMGVNAGVRYKTLATIADQLQGTWDEERGSVLLTWNADINRGYMKIEVHRAINEESKMQLTGTLMIDEEESWIDLGEFEDNDVLIPGDYYYQLVYTASNEVTDRGSITSVRVEDLMETRPQLITYPNPASDAIVAVFFLSSREEVGFRLYKSDGSLVHLWSHKLLEPGEKTVSLDVSDIPLGNYFLEAIMGEKKVTQQVVVH